jgi:hypothetical protein
MISSLEQLCLGQPEWEQRCEQLRSAESLSSLAWIALQMGLLMTRLLVEQELGHRAQQQRDWGNRPTCGTQLHSKGWQPRTMQTLVGKID